MEELLNAVRREAARTHARTAQPRMAIVSSYNPDTYAVKVKLMPEGVESGWTPVAASQVGNGWGVFSPPSIGDQVVVIFQEGAGGSPVVIGSVYSDEDRPVVSDIQGTPQGETRIVNQSGARIRLLKNGQMEIRQKAGTQVLLNPDGSVDINAPVIRVGGLGATFRTLVTQAFQAIYNTHSHGGGPPPTPQMTSAHLTTNLTGA